MVLRNRILRGYGLALALVLLVLGGAVVNLIGLGKASDAILGRTTGAFWPPRA